jgi:hypothetical protein
MQQQPKPLIKSKIPIYLLNVLLQMFGLKNLDDPTLINPYLCVIKYNLIEEYIKNLELFKPYFSFKSRYKSYSKKVSIYKILNLFDKCITFYGYKIIKKNINTYGCYKSVSYFVEPVKKVYHIKFNPLILFDCEAEGYA